MSKGSDPTDPTTNSDGEEGSTRDDGSLEALRASWQQKESDGPQAGAASVTSAPGSSGSSGSSDNKTSDNKASELSSSVLPRTCCPSCLTVFEVSPDLLAAYDTRVRCGECLGIFDALANLRRDGRSGDERIDDESVDTKSPVVPAGSSTTDDDHSHVTVVDSVAGSAEGDDNDPSLLDTTQADFDLYSGEAELPEVAYFDQTLGHQELRLDETRNDDSFSETMFVRDIADQTIDDPQSHDELSDTSATAIPLDSSVSYVTGDSPEEPLKFVYDESADEQAESGSSRSVDASSSKVPARESASDRDSGSANIPKRRRPLRSWILRSVLLLLVLVLALSLYAYRERNSLLQNRQLRPVLTSVCSLIGCRLSALVDLDALKVLKRSVFSHPTIDNALVIDLAFINEAEFEQPYPVLEIRLTDNRGGLVVQNNVTPAEYLQQWQPELVFDAGERLDLSLTVEDPGQTATSFELKFR